MVFKNELINIKAAGYNGARKYGISYLMLFLMLSGITSKPKEKGRKLQKYYQQDICIFFPVFFQCQYISIFILQVLGHSYSTSPWGKLGSKINIISSYFLLLKEEKNWLMSTKSVIIFGYCIGSKIFAIQTSQALKSG